MSFDQLVSDVRLLHGVIADDKWSVLQDLCRFAVNAGVIPAAAEVVVHDGVVERERSISTGLEKGLAVPHAFVAVLTEPKLILATAPNGIPWDALDGEPARCIAMLLAPSTPAARATHLQTLARLSGLWCDEARRSALCAVTDSDAARVLLAGA